MTSLNMSGASPPLRSLQDEAIKLLVKKCGHLFASPRSLDVGVDGSADVPLCVSFCSVPVVGALEVVVPFCVDSVAKVLGVVVPVTVAPVAEEPASIFPVCVPPVAKVPGVIVLVCVVSVAPIPEEVASLVASVANVPDDDAGLPHSKDSQSRDNSIETLSTR